eukprot:CAMPEP_0170591486 /NCGR_PEP_ID=MMETSP0224-20130122/12430_1 /TAXON_ID=285029 /ORGANISM="Togula jolla, Strain CCCM 725" /LENGTH=105 /DNA_ID=CAMNT_0010915355 /DNA_START=52 /DNA_END=369 /DNA_ORIENTATION=+
MAARRSVLGFVLAISAICLAVLALLPQQGGEGFVAASPSLRATRLGSAPLVGAPVGASTQVTLKALPEPRPNDAMLPVDLNRTSLFWGLLLILVLSVLFSSYLFN